jgi:hypothetical protein
MCNTVTFDMYLDSVHVLFHSAAAGSAVCEMKTWSHKKKDTQSDVSFGMFHHCEHYAYACQVDPFWSSSFHIEDTLASEQNVQPDWYCTNPNIHTLTF